MILASPVGEEAYPTRAAHVLATRLTAGDPDAEIVIRDLSASAPPHINARFVDAIRTPPAQRTRAQRRRLELSRRFAAEVEAASSIIIATPMINFGPPSALKAWFDHLLGPGVRWSAERDPKARHFPGRKVYLVQARVPISGGGPSAMQDFQEPHLKAMLALMSLTDVETISIDCLEQDPEIALQTFDDSLREIARRFRRA
jgi:FMN-dependent NADH-azoreductase